MTWTRSAPLLQWLDRDGRLLFAVDAVEIDRARLIYRTDLTLGVRGEDRRPVRVRIKGAWYNVDPRNWEVKIGPHWLPLRRPAGEETNRICRDA